MKKILLLCVFVSNSFFLLGQADVVSSGGDIKSSSGSLSYSVGQVFVQQVSSASGSVLDGVQQPFEISQVVGVKSYENAGFSYQVFPNPSSNYLIISSTTMSSDASVKLVDAQGRQVLDRSIVSSREQISISHLASGIYFLNLFDQNNLVKSFKIVKN